MVLDLLCDLGRVSFDVDTTIAELAISNCAVLLQFCSDKVLNHSLDQFVPLLAGEFGDGIMPHEMHKCVKVTQAAGRAQSLQKRGPSPVRTTLHMGTCMIDTVAKKSQSNLESRECLIRQRNHMINELIV